MIGSRVELKSEYRHAMGSCQFSSDAYGNNKPSVMLQIFSEWFKIVFESNYRAGLKYHSQVARFFQESSGRIGKQKQ